MPPSPLARVLGRLPSGLFVLTTGDGQAHTGLLVSWVMQAGFEPPMITVGLRQGRYVADWLTAGRPFVLNVLSQAQKRLLAHFARGFELGQPAFEGIALEYTAGGLPILSEALGHLECRPRGHVDSGDHRVFLAEATRGHLRSDDDPMVHIRRNGLSY